MRLAMRPPMRLPMRLPIPAPAGLAGSCQWVMYAATAAASATVTAGPLTSTLRPQPPRSTKS